VASTTLLDDNVDVATLIDAFGCTATATTGNDPILRTTNEQYNTKTKPKYHQNKHLQKKHKNEQRS
jgi:hypothetical protein